MANVIFSNILSEYRNAGFEIDITPQRVKMQKGAKKIELYRFFEDYAGNSVHIVNGRELFKTWVINQDNELVFNK